MVATKLRQEPLILILTGPIPTVLAVLAVRCPVGRFWSDASFPRSAEVWMTIGMENGAFGQVETLGAWSLEDTAAWPGIIAVDELDGRTPALITNHLRSFRSNN